jgi:hypothetical protein
MGYYHGIFAHNMQAVASSLITSPRRIPGHHRMVILSFFFSLTSHKGWSVVVKAVSKQLPISRPEIWLAGPADGRRKGGIGLPT